MRALHARIAPRFHRAKLRRWAREYVDALLSPAVRANEPLWQDEPHYVSAATSADALPANRWHRLAAEMGTKGPRWHDRARQEVWRLQLTPVERAWGHWLLVRRSITDPTDLTYFIVFAPRDRTDLSTVVKVRRGTPRLISGGTGVQFPWQQNHH